jgi:argininosuccinate synthase
MLPTAAPGAGNDQVRFDMIFNILIPDVGIITPIRDLKAEPRSRNRVLKEARCGNELRKSEVFY